MRHFEGKGSKIIAGCLATTMTLGAEAGAVFASETYQTEKTNQTAVIVQEKQEDTSEEIVPEYASVAVNEANFPDPVFRSVISSSFDSDRNGVLDSRELLVARNIWCDKMGVKSLKGMELLPELRGLYCMNNQIESIDISKNQQLTGVWCSGNPLTSIDLTQNPGLEWLYCSDCKLTELDVTKNPKMSYLECNTNSIKELDLSNNPELEHLTCGSCQLKELDVSHNPKLTHLDAFRNKLKTLDLSNNLKLKRLNIWDNENFRVEISHLSGLQYFNCANTGISFLDVSNNHELQKLECSYNSIKNLDLSNNPKLVVLNCQNNQLQKLDLSNNPMIRHLWAAINAFPSLDIGGNPYLQKVYKEGAFSRERKGSSLWVKEWLLTYGGDDSTGGDSEYIIWVNDDVKIEQKATPKNLVEERYSPLDKGVKESDLLTREMVVQTLYNLAGKPDVTGLKTRFNDVEAGAWYEDALLWGEEKVICVGYPYTSADAFGVGKWVTRQDVAYMLMRYSEWAGYDRAIDFGRSDDYLDYFDIDYDHWEAVCWAATWHIIEGKGEPGSQKSEQRFDPYGRVTRKDLTTFIENMLEKNNRTAKIEIPNVKPVVTSIITSVTVPTVAVPTKIPATPTPAGPTTTPFPTKAVPTQGAQGSASIEDFVERLYTIALNRPSEPKGKAFWVGELVNGKRTGGDCAHFFLIEAREFFARGLKEEAFVETLYQTFFDRASEPKGKAFWVSALKERRMSRKDVIAGFIDSTEWCNVCASYGVRSGATTAKAEIASPQAIGFADRLYSCCLGRASEAKGLKYWSLALTNLEKTGAEAAEFFFSSDEFIGFQTSNEEYVTRLYRTFMGREPERDGFSYWVGELARGADRRTVLASFAESKEFTNICAKYGIERGTI